MSSGKSLRAARLPAAAGILCLASAAAFPADQTVTKTYYQVYRGPCQSCVDHFKNPLGTCLSNAVEKSNMVEFNLQGEGCGALTYIGAIVEDAKPGTQATISWGYSGDPFWFQGVLVYAHPLFFCGPVSSGSFTTTVAGKITVGISMGCVTSGANCLCPPGEGCFLPGATSLNVTITYVPKTPQCPANNCTKQVEIQKQCDDAWGNDPIGTSSVTMCKAGCYLSCIATIVGGTPKEVNTALSNNKEGGITSEGDIENEIAADYYGFDYDAVGGTKGEIEDGLCKGFVIAEVCTRHMKVGGEVHCTDTGTKSHFVVVTGQVYDPVTNQCRFTIADPANNCVKAYLDDYPCVKSTRRFTQ